MTTDFLSDQFKQLETIFDSYKEDIANLDSVTRSWEELPQRKPEELESKIKETVKNQAKIKIYEDENGNLLLEMTFQPIIVAWKLCNDQEGTRQKV